ncbi:MAG: efflux RND transporter periplasmic adaptor subunit [Parvibaculum sp.]|uniref:efflux RND transporter periplasmic adaptor subunit n=1 Tax=Parvibaculum sp. TaxID=2024848 RepID=UPI0027246217|nr:efflux RND transporter periplasmic adaptor subunit [Parvibaculum sp.]MDO8838072.1 efflux RND transporter periplasmic adaptor subunit [Parvibaculum sp.]
MPPLKQLSLKQLSPRTIIVGILAVLAALLVILFLYRLYDRFAGQQWGGFPPPVVEVVEARLAPIEVRVSALGTLQADQSIVLTPEIQGVVTSIDFTDGQRIEAGEVVLRLNDDDLKARLAQAEARLTLTRANYQRAEQLVRQGSGTARARDEALNDFKSAEAELATAQTALDKATIKAPFSGIAGLRQVSLGQYLTAGEPIATLADIDNLRIDFRVSEVFLTRIRKGQKVGIIFDALPGTAYEGVVSAVDPVVSIDGRAVSVRALLANEGGELRPGLFGRVDIVTETRESIMVPESAIVTDQTGRRAVFVVVDGRASLRPVETGERRPGQVEIASGVEPGETVIVAGQLKVQDGEPVEPISATDEQPRPDPAG